MGRAYADGRNHDLGPRDRSNISCLSPYVRRRLVTEEEVVAAALGAHSPSAAEKFVQEVVWRAYFKGWLEQRPSVWTGYRTGLAQDLAQARGNAGLRRALAQAEEGGTGIGCFDAWSAELRATGYLHNHARMWFASIWIFTLKLPWRLGADFFLRHLLDGDPASNTLSWRWVAGLHTPGKNYVARSSNIAKHTEGRFGGIHGLAQDPPPLSGDDNPPRGALRDFATPKPGAVRVRLLTEEDGHVESLPPLATAATATLRLTDRRSPRDVARMVADADAAGLADAAMRAGGAAAAFEMPGPDQVIAFAKHHGATEIVTAYLPVGWVRDWFDQARPAFEAANLRLVEQRRDWDAAFWPHATAGFFKVKERIPAVLRSLGRGPGDLPLFAAAEKR
ncbi:deoxyribodipyrimidine photolyase [Halovulum dunhuangense]|uniref:Deoxyribodipyrimidine photolyase n=2 Tax=Halovulum dunhuangense TaxID=1505036 RepID=A0A849KZM7_9RHOB|nr:deoxyribodipyrimidine photolyase [Halovulum dunhuangense]